MMTFEGFMPETAYLPHKINNFYQKNKQNSLNTFITFILLRYISLRFN